MPTETKFTLNVNPCIITDFSSASVIGPVVTYRLGDPGFLFGNYLFEQSPKCEYNQEVTTTGQPNFITLDKVNSKFVLSETSDLALAKSFSVTLNSEIKQPEDNS